MAKFIELVNSKTPLLVDFHATWCGPCKVQDPIVKELSNKTGDELNIIKVDIDKNPQAAEFYQVRGVPTLILFKEGKIQWRQSGVTPLNQLESIVKQYI